MVLVVGLIPIFSWLWRVAGRGGFPNALWLRRLIVPYMIWLATGNILSSLVISGGAMLPITLKGSEIKDNYGWLFILGAFYGIGMALLFTNWLYMLVSFLVTSQVFAWGAILADEPNPDLWWLLRRLPGKQ